MLQHGAYTLLMDACYDRETFPTKEQAIDWLWASSKEEVEAVEFVLNKFFTLENEVYTQNRMIQEIEEYTGLCISNSINGKKGGRPKGTKNKPKETQSVNNKTQSVKLKSETKANESLTTNHKPLTTNQEPLTNNIYGFDLSNWPELPSKEIWSDFVKHRNASKAKLSQTAINGFTKQLVLLKANGWSVDDCLTEIVTRGWKGIKAEWLLKDSKGKHNFENTNYGEGGSF